ncbi:MAG: NAD(P)H-hydrate dehydratase [Bacteroidota bacterium]
MKIISAQQTREADQYSINHEPIAPIDLMERASEIFVDWFKSHYLPSQRVLVFCGPGNNGGDGLAIARLLYKDEYEVVVVIVKFGRRTSGDFDINLKRLLNQTTVKVNTCDSVASFPELLGNEIVIDAILGSGLSRPVKGFVAETIETINELKNEVVSVDIPSGLFSDTITNSPAIQAEKTLSFERPKLAFFLPSNGKFVGTWSFRSIQLDHNFIEKQDSIFNLITPGKIASIYKPRTKYGHKGTYGHSLIVGGAKGKIGAAVLAAKGALRAGTGLLTTYLPECGYSIMQIAVPEAMVLTDQHHDELTLAPELSKYKAIGIGPGIGTSKRTAFVLKSILEKAEAALVIDADALNILSESPGWLDQLPDNCIMTPHPKEFERLFGKTKNDIERLERLSHVAAKFKAWIILKGAHSAIACPSGDIWFNNTGNPGMGTGGSGDVLTGILTALLAQGYSPFDSAVMGVHLHGLAGDMAADELSQEALAASDIVEYLGKAFIKIKSTDK